MVTRTKFATKSTVAAQPAAHSSVLDEALKRYTSAADDLLVACNAPSLGRLVVATIIGLLTYSTACYAVALPLIGWVAAAAITMTGSAFISFLATMLSGFALGGAAGYLGYRVYQFVVDFDTTRAQQLGRQLRSNATSKTAMVRAWFNRNEVAGSAA
mgnify:CR=1 FL=1